MHNSAVMTAAAQSLYGVGDCSVLCGYDGTVYDQIRDIINTETTITITLPNLDQIAIYGYVQKFTPNALQKGQHPEAVAVFVFTNRDPSTQEEEEFVYTTAAGTTL